MANGNKKKPGLLERLKRSGALGTKARVSTTKASKRRPLKGASMPKRRPKKKKS